MARSEPSAATSLDSLGAQAGRKVLFVDDEPRVLAGLERLLFDWEDEWDLTFVTSAAEALEQLGRSPFDVVVTDMKMPHMDGADLLRAVREEHPRTVRIVLTGHAEMDATLRAMPVAHGFLTKPCDPSDLQEAVRRASCLRDALCDDAAVTLVGSIDSLPVRPAIYNQLTAEIASGDASISRLCEIVSADTGLCTKILHLTNSSFFGVGRKFVNLQHAVSFMGASMLKQVVLSAEVFRDFGAKKNTGLSLEAEQARSLICGAIARAMVADQGDDMKEMAFLSGMLHDVGKLIWALRAPKTLRTIIKKGGGIAVEQQVAGTTHAIIGSCLLGLWGIDSRIVEAVAHHHDPAKIDRDAMGLPTVVHVAEFLTHAVAAERAGKPLPEGLDTDHVEKLGLEKNLAEWMTTARSVAKGSER